MPLKYLGNLTRKDSHIRPLTLSLQFFSMSNELKKYHMLYRKYDQTIGIVQTADHVVGLTES